MNPDHDAADMLYAWAEIFLDATLIVLCLLALALC